MFATTRLVLLIAVVWALCAIVVPANSDTISGMVTIDGAGPIAGAMVRTDGDPSYSAITGSNGSYSITNLPPSGNGEVWAVLASKTGYNPQRMVVSTGGSTAAANFALRPQSGTLLPLNLPAPLSFGEPPSAPTAPGDNFPVSFADSGALPDPNAPKIADHNDCVKPDESFTMTGCSFTTRTGADAGTDTTVWVWSRTSSAGGVLRQARLWKVSATTITATLPDDVPFGMYLVWVQNSVGVSDPICLNRTTPTWTGTMGTGYIGSVPSAIGPIDNITYPGGTKRVFGRNLTYNHSVTRANSSDPATSYVYIQPAAGGAFIPCPTTTPVPASAPNIYEPYAVMFTVPIGTPNGSYKVFVHNGHGGVYGWSDGLDLIVQDRWQRGTGIITVNPGTDPARNDTTAIQVALNAVGGYTNGGTVQLASGNFILKTPISIPANVELKGAGMDSTTLRLQAAPNGTENVGYPTYPTRTSVPVVVNGNRGAISDLTIYQIYGYGIPSADLNIPGGVYYSTLSRLRIKTDQGDSNWVNMNALSWLASQTEVVGCEMGRSMAIQGNCWMHDNTFYGDVGPWWMAEAPCEIYGSNNVYELNHTETQNWPIQPNGSSNYDPSANNWALVYKVWAKRVALTYCCYAYIGHNTSKDVAVDDNRGEMFLFHPSFAQWWGQVLSNDGLTMTVRTDGKLFDQSVDQLPGYGIPVPCGQPLTADLPWWQWFAGKSVSIISGRGAGQVRRLQSWWTAGTGFGVEPPNKIRVDKPWSVAPDSTSVVILGTEYHENTVYGNTLNAFPPNYTLANSYSGSASSPAQMGVSYRGVYEANTSRRTNGGPLLVATSTGPCMWNEMRDNQVIDAMTMGYAMQQVDNNPIAPCLYGNAIRSSSGNVLLPCSAYAAGVFSTGEGNVLENLNLTAGTGYYLGYIDTCQGLGSPNLYRKGTVTSGNSPYQPVFVRSMTGGSLLVGNTYSGSSQNYYYNTGLSSFTVPVANYRCARFTAYTGNPGIQGALIPVVDAGTAGMTWTVTASDPWITAAVQSNGTLAAESTAGRLSVSVDTTGLAAGHYSGSATINTGGPSVKVGVELDVLSGAAPPAPNAAFTVTPAAGTAPRSVSFNGSSSTGSGLSYYWDFGDGSYGSGATTSHIYAQGTYTPVLTVTDGSGMTDQSWTSVALSPTLTSVSLSGSPGAPIDAAGTAVALTATAVGGYQVQYEFLVNNGSGWTVIRDYQAGNTCTWTPSAAGYYQVKAQAKASDSTKAYDVSSRILSYPVGQLPSSGIKLWLRADAGVTMDASGLISTWADQSGNGNNVTQSSSPKQPTYVDNVVNGLPVVRFGGGGQMLQAASRVLSGSTGFTTIAVVKFNSLPGTSYQYVWFNGVDTQTGGYGSWIITTNFKLRDGWSSSGYGKVTAPSDSVVGTWYKVTSRYTSSTGVHKLWINDWSAQTTNTTGSNLTGGTFTLGNFGPSASQGLYGDIQEMVIYDRDLSDTEITNAQNYLTARLTPPTAIAVDRLKDLKPLGDGVSVSISSAKVATVASGIYADGGIYVEEIDRTCGLKVLNAGTVAEGDNLTLSGTMDTDATTGERVLRVTNVTPGSNGPLGALAMTNKAFAGQSPSGSQPSGQLVRVWGKVTAKDSLYITVDDGSGSPVKARVDGLSAAITKTVNVGDYASVCGPAGLAPGGVPVVRPRSDSDIQVY